MNSNNSAGIKLSHLNDLMQPIFGAKTIKNETVMFLEKNESKRLLFPIESIISVTSYDGETVYKEGRDYLVVDGNLKILNDSTIPCITKELYYNCPHSKLITVYNGNRVPTYWGEGEIMTKWQINVTYTHSGECNAFLQNSQIENFKNFIKKLHQGEDVTVLFYGDSITYGANASWIMNQAPYQLSYPILFTQALADLFGYTIHYEAANLKGTSPVPATDYVAGSRGNITYVNSAVGGWTSETGKNNFESYVKDKVDLYGCDLLIIGFGMNDVNIDPALTAHNVKFISDSVLRLNPDVNIVLIATMVPNPDGINWYGNQDKQGEKLKSISQKYLDDGVACGVCDMTSLSLSVLERKDFHDYSGNNINHPNDFFVRVYAQTLLQALIGYENIE